MTENERFLSELLQDVRATLENYQAEKSTVRLQLVKLLNRQNAKGEQPFKVRKQ
ncbi:hypothetical protein [Vibrio sp. 10N.247.311.51]|uniref:hypothetical protein n=1 Tax=Vibrio sp. 10N.247.311.51 TaxID=3229996 RepID=UPI003553E371